MSANTQILLLCDSPAMVGSLEPVLRQVTAGREIRVAKTERIARGFLAKEQFDIVFVHLSGGPLASAKFLDEVWKQAPKTSRFLVAESIVDPDALVRCVLCAHQFIPWPVEPQALRDELVRADSIKRFVRNEKIQLLVSKMRTLPSRPSLYLEVMRELRSPAASAATVGELVSKDFAISTKLIQVANSAFFGQDQQVSDPAAAVMVLGLETTAALVLSIEAFARFDKVKPLYFSIDRVWKHSQSLAEVVRKICETMGCDPETSGEAYTAGLLHDIGKLAFAQNFEQEYQQALKKAEDSKLPVYQVEEEVFGANHAEAGAYLLAVWGLPLPIVEAVADHHAHPGELNAPFSATTALHLAEQVVVAPERFEEIAAGYPSELGLLPNLDKLRALFGVAKDRKSENRAESDEVRASVPEEWTTPNPAPLERERSMPVESPATVVRPDVRRQRRKSIYMAFAAVFALFALLTDLFLRKPSRANETVARPDKAVAQKVPVPAAHNKPVREGTPDPVPAVVRAAALVTKSTAELTLQAIMYNREKSSLVINGLVLHLGDSVEGWQVVSVKEREVTLESNGEKRTLALR